MYKRIAAGRIRKVFENIAAADYEAALDGAPDDIHHVFPGDNPLGGERHTRDTFLRWFERLHRLFPELDFELQRIAVKGPPWDMWVAVKWSDRGRAADGEPYENEGAHWIHIHRGRPVRVQAYLDTDRVTASCKRMATAGIEEAAAAPITD